MRSRTRSLLCLAPLALLLASAPAAALSPEAAEAEHTRLTEEMRKLAKRNAWHGVEKQYQSMLDLQKDGVVLTYEDHMKGAEAARELGRITDVYNRLQSARVQQKGEEVRSWLREIESNYGMALLVRDDRYSGDTELAPSAMPFDPAKRAAIGAAQQALVDEGRYEGLLPHGDYTFGGKPFVVVEGQELPPEVILAPEGSNTRRLAQAPRRNGLRFQVGPGFANVGDSYSDSAVGFQPTEGRSGGLLRAALGGSLQLGDSPAGLMVEAGYHGMFPDTVAGTGAEDVNIVVGEGFQAASADATARMNLFFVQAGPTLWLGRVEVAAAVGWAIGGISLVSPVACANPSDSASNCSGPLTDVPDEIGGTLKAPGGSLGLTWLPKALDFKMGRGTYGAGLGLQGGLWRDDARSYPWGQLALTLTPTTSSN